MEFKDKRVLILGIGETGLSMARHLAAEGALLSAADTREHPPGQEALVGAVPGIAVACGPLQEPLFENIDAVAVSPGVPVSGPLADACVLLARARGLPFLGDIELFALALEREKIATGYDPKILAITGTACTKASRPDGCSRVSAADSSAPSAARWRAIDSPVSPMPRIRTRLSLNSIFD